MGAVRIAGEMVVCGQKFINFIFTQGFAVLIVRAALLAMLSTDVVAEIVAGREAKKNWTT